MGNELHRVNEESTTLATARVLLADPRKIPGFDELPPEKRIELIRQHAQNMVEVTADHNRRLSKSLIAEKDLNVIVGVVNGLDQERKIYAIKEDFEMGSGPGTITIKGGDVRFIVPVLLALGIIAVVLVLLLRH